jgi:adenine/guanine/hypoxanthine permease
MLYLPDIFAALATLADAIGEGFVALTLGFAAKPAGLGFLIGAILALAFGSIVPVSFEVESLTIVSRLANRDWKKMAYMVLIAGILGTILGFAGVYGMIVKFIEGTILSGMLAGVGIILSFVAIELFKENKFVGGTSIVFALVTFWALSKDPNNLIYALFISVIAALVAARFVPFEAIPTDKEREKLQLIPLTNFTLFTDITVIRGALALLALRTGTSIAYSTIDGQMANLTPNVNHTNIIAGLSGVASSLFGGPPVEPIISGTAAAPHAVASGVLMMFIMGVILLLGLLPWLAKFVPASAVSGFLLLLGAVLAFAGNVSGVVTATDAVSGPITVVVTAATFDPFLGMVAGIIVRLVSGLLIGS